MIAGLGHVAFRTSDIDRTLEFYCEKLGLTEAFRLNNDDGKPWIVYVRVAEGEFIEFFPTDASPSDGPLPPVGYAHLCLRVDDIHATRRDLSARGMPIDDEVRKGRSGCLQSWLADPDGNRIELMEILPDSLQAQN